MSSESSIDPSTKFLVKNFVDACSEAATKWLHTESPSLRFVKDHVAIAFHCGFDPETTNGSKSNGLKSSTIDALTPEHNVYFFAKDRKATVRESSEAASSAPGLSSFICRPILTIRETVLPNIKCLCVSWWNLKRRAACLRTMLTNRRSLSPIEDRGLRIRISLSPGDQRLWRSLCLASRIMDLT